MSELFPEVDGDEVSTAPTPPPARVSAGRRAQAALSRLLALPELLPEGCVTRAEYSTRDAEVRVTVESPALPATQVMFSPVSPRPAVLRTRQLNLGYSGEALTPALRALLSGLQARLMNAPFELVQRAASLLDPTPPPAAPTPTAPRTHQPGVEATRPLPWDQMRSIAWNYQHPAGWRSFFETAEMHRGIFHGLRGPITMVLHADIECHASDAPRFDGSVTFFNFPRQEVWSTERGEVDSRQRDGAGFLVTDMSDRDVIKGADTRLERLLQEPAQAPGGEPARGAAPGMVFVVPTCISLITGDDVEAAAERRGTKRRVPVINAGDVDDPIATMFDRLAAEPGFADRTRRDARVNLVGLPLFEGYHALLELLREGGVEVGCEILPTFDLETAREYMTAAVQVIYPSDQARGAMERVLSKLGLVTLTPPPPFGVAGTREWIAAIAAATGREVPCASALERAWTPLAPRWESLRRRAFGAALGFVVDAETAGGLRNPARLLGVPLLRLALEAGFEVEVLQYVDRGAPEPPPLIPEAASTRFFRDPAELRDALRGARARAFYSDVFADERLTSAGRQVFSLRDVAVGLDGAVETARRLLARCENPFLRRYGAYLPGESA